MNLTNPYWSQPSYLKSQRGLKPMNNYGFLFKLPHHNVVTAGYYYGENPGYGRRELVFSDQPEYFAVDGKIPASGGLPLIDPKDPIFKFKRSNVTKKF